MTEKKATYSTQDSAHPEDDEYMKQLHKYWCSMKKAAEILGVDDSQARRLAREKRIVTDEIDNGYRLVFIPSLYEYTKTKNARGRKPGSKHGKKVKKV